jgi:spoIIIJ-associated protein
MKKIEAQTLELAYINAAKEFTCSITELEINIVQNSSSGFLGMFKKTAIIEVERKSAKAKSKNQRNKRDGSSSSQNSTQQPRKYESIKEDKTKDKRNKKEDRQNQRKPKREDRAKKEIKSRRDAKQKIDKVATKEEKPFVRREFKKQVLKVEIEKAIEEIGADINRLFKQSCYEMDDVKVSKYNEDTILIEFGGVDAALLIGKEGYRYKALSYFLYNWINIKYGANIRLEIAEFLKNQEEMIGKYLVPVIERVNNNGRGQTKVLDGVLIKIALEKLRFEFPEKYVGIKSARSGGRFIVINDFNRKSK